MNIKDSVGYEMNEIYYGQGLDDGLTLKEFVEIVYEGVREWADAIVEEFKDDEEFKDLLTDWKLEIVRRKIEVVAMKDLHNFQNQDAYKGLV